MQDGVIELLEEMFNSHQYADISLLCANLLAGGFEFSVKLWHLFLQDVGMLTDLFEGFKISGAKCPSMVKQLLVEHLLVQGAKQFDGSLDAVSLYLLELLTSRSAKETSVLWQRGLTLQEYKQTLVYDTELATMVVDKFSGEPQLLRSNEVIKLFYTASFLCRKSQPAVSLNEDPSVEDIVVSINCMVLGAQSRQEVLAVKEHILDFALENSSTEDTELNVIVSNLYKSIVEHAQLASEIVKLIN